MMRSFRIAALLLALALVSSALPALAASSDVPIDEAHFPNEYFRSCIQKFDKNKDGVLSKTERNNVKKITANYWDADEKVFTSLNGIKYFPNLTSLSVEGLSCKQVDLSSNKKLTSLNLSFSSISTININKNTKLTYLCLEYNNLSKVDVSKSTKLKYLYLRGNALKKIDVSKNKQLTYLDVSNNKLDSLTVKNNTKLQTLECSNNRLKKLSLTKNKKLTRLNCNTNKLTSLSLSNNTALTGLMAYDNPALKKLDLSNCKKLQKIITGNKKKKSTEGDPCIYWGEVSYDGEGVSKTVSISPYTKIVAGKKTLYKGK